MGTFAYSGVKKFVSDDQGGFWQQLQRGSVSLEGDLGSGLHFCVLSARAHTCGLGAGLNKSDRVDGTSGWLVSQ